MEEQRQYLLAEIKDQVLHIEARNLTPEIMALIASNLIGVILTKPNAWKHLEQVQGALNGQPPIVESPDTGN